MLGGAAARALPATALPLTSTMNGMPSVSACSVPADPGFGAVNFWSDVVYQPSIAPYPYQRWAGSAAPAGSSFLTQDGMVEIEMPRTCTTDAPCPVVLEIHGGGWTHAFAPSGTAPSAIPTACAESAADLCQILKLGRIRAAALGIGTVYVEYPLQNGANFYENDIPDQVGAVLCAARWLTANGGTYGIDPTRMAWQGYSAGSQIAAIAGIAQNDHPAFAPMAAANPTTLTYEGGGGYDHPNCANTATLSPARAIVPFYGFHHAAATAIPGSIYTRALNVRDGTAGGVVPNVGRPTKPYIANYAQSVKYDSVLRLNANSPAVFVARGTTDGISPLPESDDLFEQAAALGLEAGMFQVAGKGHGYYPFNQGTAGIYQAEDCSLMSFYSQVLFDRP